MDASPFTPSTDERLWKPEVHGEARLKPAVRERTVQRLPITNDDIAAIADQGNRALDSLALDEDTKSLISILPSLWLPGSTQTPLTAVLPCLCHEVKAVDVFIEIWTVPMGHAVLMP